MTDTDSFAAFIGIDWADREHAVCLASPETLLVEHRSLTQQAESLDQWATELRHRFGGRPVAVCLEQSRGPLAYALMKYEFLVLFPINPKQLAKYRQAFTPSGAKDDPTDAELLCRFVKEHHQHLRRWKPDDAQTRGLRLLTEARRQCVEQRKAYGNRLLQELKESYPLALTLKGKNIYGDRFLTLLAKYPTQRELQRASPRQLVKLLSRRRRVADDLPTDPQQDPRVLAIRAAQALVNDAMILQAARLAVVHLVALLQQFNETIETYDRQIAALLAQHAEANLFAGLPGAAAAIQPRLVAAFGTDRQRYASAEELQTLSGVAPITVKSGKSRVVKRRRACPHFLRQTFHEFARCSRLKSAWAQAYYQLLRARGYRFHAAIRALAFKWIRILFRCWKERQPYEEERYLEQLRKKNSPLLAYLKTNTISN
jgi:transposase